MGLIMSTPAPAEIIRRKRDGHVLSDAEIESLIRGLSNKSVADYQMAAFLMAVFFRGLNAHETVVLTREMKNSGRTLDWTAVRTKFPDKPLADKHSSGGVGDKISLILAPLAAACGMIVPMMSGRGLGHTGGTVDKLESIPGMTLKLSDEQMIAALEEVGACIMAQADDLCPADKALYALRDVTATVENVSLITASIVSKKLAEGIDHLIFDVKCGDGAFMNSIEQARALAKSLVTVSCGAGLQSKALITDMNAPLGSMIGNSMEVEESLWILKNEYPSRAHQEVAKPLVELTLRLTAEMCLSSGISRNVEEALSLCRAKLQDGSAYDLFEKMVRTQGARFDWVRGLRRAPALFEVKAERGGALGQIKSRALGVAGLEIGAGRKRKEDSIDPAVGFEVLVRSGERVEKDQTLLKAYLRDESQWTAIRPLVQSIFTFDDEPYREPPLVLEEVVNSAK